MWKGPFGRLNGESSTDNLNSIPKSLLSPCCVADTGQSNRGGRPGGSQRHALNLGAGDQVEEIQPREEASRSS